MSAAMRSGTRLFASNEARTLDLSLAREENPQKWSSCLFSSLDMRFSVYVASGVSEICG